MRNRTSRALSLALVSTLAACSGGGGSSPVASAGSGGSSSLPSGSGSSPTSAIRYGVESTKGAVLQTTAPSSTVSFGVFMRMRDPLGLVRYAASANDPKSGSYRHWLSPQDIANRFGASQADYAKVAAYFRSNGLGVASWQQREMLFVHGSRAAAEKAMGARFGTYTKDGVTFTALQSAPAALANLPIAALPGVSTFAAKKAARDFVRRSGGSPTFGVGYSAPQIASAFDYTGAYNAGYTGKGITIGVIGTGPISAADYPAYRSAFSVGGSSTVAQVNVTDAGTAGTPAGYGGQPAAGTFTAPPPTTEQCTIPATGPDASCNPEDIEAQIDTEQTFGLARDANVLFYIGYAASTTALGDGTNLEGLDLYDYEIQQAINDDTADVLSLSFGAGELDDVGSDFNVTGGTVDFTTSPGPMQFASLAAEGVAVFASSGDQGNLQCLEDGTSNSGNLCVAYPSIDPNVVAVGGVNSPIGNNGRLSGPITVWGSQTGGNDPVFGASNGGVSAYFPQPAFQTGAVGVIGSTRNSPDVALEADPQTGVAVYYDAAFPDASLAAYGGTSVAAPQTAAMWALVLQGCASSPSTCTGVGTGAHAYRLGDPNPAFYTAYKSATVYASTFYDVLFGNNALTTCSALEGTCPTPGPTPTPVPGYSAGTGYDRATGLGVPFGRASVKTFAGV